MNATDWAFNGVTALWVALGGAIGSVARFAIGELLRRPPLPPQFPWATFTVNLTGAFAIGWIFGWAADASISPQHRAFLMVGVLGGFTTFSAFSLETAGLLQSAQFGKALLYVISSVVLSVAATFAGFGLART